jgi:mannose-1-phosphate guanylyltransferase/mannose-1-phosphate guanylyltransferase/mannose-6-phosphate isomerase
MAEYEIYQEERPWGNFRQFTHNSPSTVKILSVKPNASLSLQYHNNREEFWRVLSGQPVVTIGEQKIQAKSGDEFKIEKLQPHRLEAGDEAVQVLEIAYGNFDESDIIRIEDKYGRT